MKSYFKYYYLFLVVTLFFVSCQDETVDVEEPMQEQLIAPNSELSNLMLRASSNSVSSDNIVDNSSCFSVDLPVTVVVGNITITIENEEGFDELEEILEDFEDEIPEFIFPITIVSADYTETVIENQSQLEALLEDCEEPDDIIECVDFVYPISFSTLNTDFVVIDTITIESNEDLYEFLEELDDDTTLVALNFPVTLEFANGESETVNSNTELSDAILSVGDDCEIDDFDNCDSDDIRNKLKECVWDLDDEFDDFDDLTAQFNEDFTLKITGENLQEPITGTWEVVGNDNSEVFLILSDLTALSQDLGGEWLVVECDDDDEIEIVKNDFELELEQNCDTEDAFDCFESFDAYIELCDENNDGEEIFDLTTVFANCTPSVDMVSYHVSQADADANMNSLQNPQSYVNTTAPQTIYVRVELDNEFEVFELTLKLEDCTTNNDSCTEAEVVERLKECKWEISSYAGDDSYNVFSIDFMENNELSIIADNETYTGNWTTDTDGGGVFLEFSDISGGNVMVLNGINFKVVECTETQIIFHDVTDSANELVLNKECD